MLFACVCGHRARAAEQGSAGLVERPKHASGIRRCFLLVWLQRRVCASRRVCSAGCDWRKRSGMAPFAGGNKAGRYLSTIGMSVVLLLLVEVWRVRRWGCKEPKGFEDLNCFLDVKTGGAAVSPTMAGCSQRRWASTPPGPSCFIRQSACCRLSSVANSSSV